MKRVVVTGGAGFIGSHLVDRLVQDGYRVTVIDNFSTGLKQNLVHLNTFKNLKVIEDDINDLANLKPCFQNIDTVFHLAALADIVPSIQRPLDYYHANVSGTVSALELSRLGGVKKFIYTASSSCYGIAKVYPTPENAEISPQYPYALTKRLGEECALHWAKVYKLPVLSLRLFNVYGPRARTGGTYGAVFGVFLAQKLAGRPFTVVGDGTQTRDFTYVTDVVDTFIQAAHSPLTGEIFNVGSGDTYSINKLVQLLKGDVSYVPKRPGEPDVTFADIRKITSALKWIPKVSFEEGVRLMLEHISDWKTAPVWDENSIASATKEWFVHLSDKLTEIRT